MVRTSCLVGVALLACAPGASPSDAEAELLEADRAFARATAERGADGWASSFADSSIMFQRTGVVQGRDRIREAMRARWGLGEPHLRWEPRRAMVAASGELGYTVGRWWLESRASRSGDSTLRAGNYVTIWRLEADGSWKVVVDIGNDDPRSR